MKLPFKVFLCLLFLYEMDSMESVHWSIPASIVCCLPSVPLVLCQRLFFLDLPPEILVVCWHLGLNQGIALACGEHPMFNFQLKVLGERSSL